MLITRTLSIPSLIWLLVFSGIPSDSALGAYLGLCPETVTDSGADYTSSSFGLRGARQKLIITDAPLPETCQSIELGAEGDSVRWASVQGAVVPSDAGLSRVILQGSFPALGSGSVAVSEVIPLELPREAATGPVAGEDALIGSNLLGELTAHAFGIEARSRWSESRELSCQPGAAPAGVELSSPRPWPAEAPLTLVITASGSGQFQLAIADRTRRESEAPLPVGSIQLSGAGRPRTFVLRLPANQLDWSAVTLVCPEGEASLQLSELRLLPGHANSGASGLARSAWLWSPALWHEPRLLWQIVEAENVGELYLTIPVDRSGNLDEEALTQFMRQASARQLLVWPVIGDRRDVLQESLAALRQRVSAYRAYNESVSHALRLQGVQFDIEPYLLAGFNVDPHYWRRRYLATIMSAREVAGPDLPLELVVPVWWGSHPAFGPAFLDQLVPLQVNLTVMNYRTDPYRLVQDSLPFLSWGDRHGRSVRIALEAGSLADETRLTFIADAREGELWQIELAGQPVLLLFDSNQQLEHGNPFRFAFESTYRSTNLTFAGNLQHLSSIAEVLESELRVWPSFAGLAVHGLDEIYRRLDGEQQ